MSREGRLLVIKSIHTLIWLFYNVVIFIFVICRNHQQNRHLGMDLYRFDGIRRVSLTGFQNVLSVDYQLIIR